ncbi:MAG: PQQ-binding-like beta-propeller repeat protein [Candidatus Sumerlaeia bacterium]
MKFYIRIFTIACLFLAGLCVTSIPAQDWPQWRGPFHNGSAQADNLPDTFGPDENLKWAVDLPGEGASTPIIVGDRIFLTAQDGEQTLWAFCLDRQDGSIKWKLEIGKGFARGGGVTAAAPSASCDGERVYFFFGTGELLATDLEGAILWQRNVIEEYGDFELIFKYGATPLLHEGRLYLSAIHGDHKTTDPDKSYLLAVDARSGENVWKVDRHTDAVKESKQAYTSPYPFEHNGQTRLIILGGDYVTAHDLDSGKELWRSANYNTKGQTAHRTVPTPASIDGMLICPAPRRTFLFAIDPDQNPDAANRPFAWTTEETGSDVCSPLVYENKLFVLDGRQKQLSRIDPRSGKILGSAKMDIRPPMDASPTAADGKIFCVSKAGHVAVLSAEDTPKVLHQIDLGGKDCRASIAIAHNQIFIRANERLYCFGQ